MTAVVTPVPVSASSTTRRIRRPAMVVASPGTVTIARLPMPITCTCRGAQPSLTVGSRMAFSVWA